MKPCIDSHSAVKKTDGCWSTPLAFLLLGFPAVAPCLRIGHVEDALLFGSQGRIVIFVPFLEGKAVVEPTHKAFFCVAQGPGGKGRIVIFFDDLQRLDIRLLQIFEIVSLQYPAEHGKGFPGELQLFICKLCHVGKTPFSFCSWGGYYTETPDACGTLPVPISVLSGCAARRKSSNNILVL